MEYFIHSIFYQPIRWLVYGILLIAGTAIVLIPIFRPDKILKKPDNYVGHLTIKRRFQRLSIYGKFMLFSAIIAIVFGIINTKLDNNESSIEQNQKFDDLKHKATIKDSTDKAYRRQSDSTMIAQRERDSILNQFRNRVLVDSLAIANHLTREAKLESKNLQLELKSEHEENIALQHQLNSPTIGTDGQYPINPLLQYDSTSGRYSYFFYYVNGGPGKAESIIARYYYFDLGGNYLGTTLGRYDDTASFLLPKGETFYVDFQFHPANQYVLVEIKFKNEFGQSQKPFVQVFNYNIDFVNKNMPLVTKTEREAIMNKFYELRANHKI